MMETQTPLVSVVVLVQDNEKKLKRCLTSVVNQSYGNLQVICVVNEKNTECKATVDKYKSDNFSVVGHKSDKGLFEEYLLGAEQATGDYILFVGSNDHISIDWVRMLLQAALENGADIVNGQNLFEDADEECTYHTLDTLRAKIMLEGENVFDRFLRQHGTCKSWHRIWNKLYAKKLWDNLLPEAKRFSQSNNIDNSADMALSVGLWASAQKMTNVLDGATYFRKQEDNLAENLVGMKDVEKEIEDWLCGFAFFEQILKNANLWDKYQEDFYTWKLYSAKQCMTRFGKLPGVEKKLRSCFEISETDTLSENIYPNSVLESGIGKLDRQVYEWGEDIKRAICKSGTKVISFDIYDTLLFRPFYFPSDAFYMLNHDFNKYLKLKSFINFARIRMEAERICREETHIRNRHYDDITLDEIYEQLERSYAFPHDAIEYIKNREIENEFRFCYPRKMGKQLYQLAVQQGKRIVITSDMYLPRNVIEKLLSKNGYSYEKLYLSSDLRLTKASSRVFQFITKDLKVKGKDILHIGDNWWSDMLSPSGSGLVSLFLENPIPLFNGTNTAIYSGKFFGKVMLNKGMREDLQASFYNYVGLRNAYGLCANTLYDNPYRPTDKDTDLDADPYRIGYGVLGGYLLAVTNWIAQNAKKNGNDRVNFVARDGYLPMLAYDILRQYDTSLPPSNYLYLSRKSLALVDIFDENDIQSVVSKVNCYAYSPAKVYKLFSSYLNVSKEEFQKELKYSDILFETKIADSFECDRVLATVGKHLQKNKLLKDKALLKQYFEKLITPQSLLFDIGYSGRAEGALSGLLGYKVNSLYVHANLQMLDDRRHLFNFDNNTFYDYRPKITGVVREHVFMKLAPSTLGYKEVDGNMQPVFEKYKGNSIVDATTSILQQGALDFVRDYYKFFGDKLEEAPYRNSDMAMIFEYYLHYSKNEDHRPFACVEFEDDLGLGNKINVFDFWSDDLVRFGLAKKKGAEAEEFRYEKDFVMETVKYFKGSQDAFDEKFKKYSRIKRAWFFLLFEPRTFWKKLFKKRKKSKKETEQE